MLLVKLMNYRHLDKRLRELESNTERMSLLFQLGLINAREGDFLYKTPPKINVSSEKILGMLYGVAIGDALGSPYEGKRPKPEIVRAYATRSHITDDTQMTFWTVEVLLPKGLLWRRSRAERLDPWELADRFTKERIIGIGGTVKDFLRNYKKFNLPWFISGVPSAGNGALMRISPLVLPYLIRPSKEMWADSVLDTIITHNDPLAISASVAFVNITYKLLGMDKLPQPEWFIEEYVSVARDIEGDNTTYKPRTKKIRYKGPAWEFIEKYVRWALDEQMHPLEFGNYVHSGGYLLETVPVVLLLAMYFIGNAYKMVTRAASWSYDSDTIGAISGYLCGALHGTSGFPPHLLVPVMEGPILPSRFQNLARIAAREFLKN